MIKDTVKINLGRLFREHRDSSDLPKKQHGIKKIYISIIVLAYH